MSVGEEQVEASIPSKSSKKCGKFNSVSPQVTCPLCMELLEIDDVNFFPCTCGYQICRFCWHRIRTDENGLCPACRKQYQEDPAEFKPLTEDELQRMRKERRQKDVQRKQKAAENRKHLANVRVVQRNLVFVLGLSQRLSESEVLKKHEYFGKFGKIHKVVINQSTTYAGSQVHGPSASAYVTYLKSDDALRAILAVNNVHIDGRTLKASLGTTKYCSHFLKGTQCNKTDCMYLHELGEEAASFTKEEMQMGKHQEYEQKLLEQFLNNQNTANNQLTNAPVNQKIQTSRKKSNSPINAQDSQPVNAVVSESHENPKQHSSSHNPSQHPPPNSGKDAWPSLVMGNKAERMTTNGNRPSHSSASHTNRSNSPHSQNRTVGNGRKKNTLESEAHCHIPDITQETTDGIRDVLQEQINASTVPRPSSLSQQSPPVQSLPQPPHFQQSPVPLPPSQSPPTQFTQTLSQYSQGQVLTQQSQSQPSTQASTQFSPCTSQFQPTQLGSPSQGAQSVNPVVSRKSLLFDNSANSLSFFSGNTFTASKNTQPPGLPPPELPVTLPTTSLTDSMTVTSTTDWSEAFGFKSKEIQDDDLGFDPCDESFKGLADLIEKENGVESRNHYSSMSHSMLPPGHVSAMHPQVHSSHPRSLPPGFSIGQIQQTQQIHQQQIPQRYFTPEVNNKMDLYPYSQPGYSNMQNSFHNPLPDRTQPPPQPHHQQPDMFSMKDMQEQLRSLLPNINISFGAPPVGECSSPQRNNNNSNHKSWQNNSTQPDLSWMAHDPAILSSGNIKDGTLLSDSTPHWLKSIRQLTEPDSTTANHRLPFVQQFPFSASNSWPPQPHNPPPGFQAPIRHNTQHPEPHTLSEGLQ